MEIFRKLFAEKILKFHEGTNRMIQLMLKIPVFEQRCSETIFTEDKTKLRTALGVLAQIFVLLYEFIKKYIYVALFMYIPYMLIAQVRPLVAMNQERTLLFMFFILTTIGGSIANNTMFAMAQRDYLMVKVMLVSPYMNCLGRLFYKMISEFIFYTIILCMFGVTPYHAIMTAIVTIAARPIGEAMAILSFDHIPKVYDNRHIYNGIILALSVLAAYGVPFLTRRVSRNWMVMIHPVFVIFMLLFGAIAMLYLWKYKHYREIMREALHNTRSA